MYLQNCLADFSNISLDELRQERRWAEMDGNLERFAELDVEVRQRERKERLTGAQIPLRARNYSLDSSPAAPALVARCREWLDSPSQALYLHGPTGIGKTGLAAGLLMAAIDGGSSGRFVAVPDALTRLREAAGGAEDGGRFRQQLRADFERVNLVVLDDLGVGAWSAWVEETVYSLVETRYANPALRTVVTSNLAPAQLPAAIGDRAAWRILEMSGPFVVKGPGPNLRARAVKP